MRGGAATTAAAPAWRWARLGPVDEKVLPSGGAGGVMKLVVGCVGAEEGSSARSGPRSANAATAAAAAFAVRIGDGGFPIGPVLPDRPKFCVNGADRAVGPSCGPTKINGSAGNR